MNTFAIASSRRSPLTSRLVQGGGLLLAGAGVLTQFLVGVPGFPPVPPGPFILGLSGAGVLALRRHRWPTIVGLVAAAFVAGGALIEGSFWSRLLDPGHFSFWIGVVVMWLGLVVALVSGAVSVWRTYRP